MSTLELLKRADLHYMRDHADTVGVTLFAEDMKSALNSRHLVDFDYWYDPNCPIIALMDGLKKCINKGDMVGIANFAMMIHYKKILGHDKL